MKFALRLFLTLFPLVSARQLPAQVEALDTQLMLATVKIANPDSTATAFVLSRHRRDDDSKTTRYVLVTAGHVLARMKGDQATGHFHKQGQDGGYVKLSAPIRIRENGKDLWTKHPTADVAAMDFTPPADARLPAISVDHLASDSALTRYEIHPGDAVKCVGFPHANQFEANEAGFGVTRGGCIASFPLLPTRKTRTFLIDANTFEGDSGGPVYLTETNRFYDGKVHSGRVQLILGLVIGQHFIDEEYRMVYQNGKFRHRMGLAIVAHAATIRETIERLPRDR